MIMAAVKDMGKNGVTLRDVFKHLKKEDDYAYKEEASYTIRVLVFEGILRQECDEYDKNYDLYLKEK